jgi:hypothetical protein
MVVCTESLDLLRLLVLAGGERTGVLILWETNLEGWMSGGCRPNSVKSEYLRLVYLGDLGTDGRIIIKSDRRKKTVGAWS